MPRAGEPPSTTAAAPAGGDVGGRSGALARIILDEMYQFVALLDPDGVLLEVNQTALDAAGLARGETVGRPFWELSAWQVSHETVERLRRAIADAAAGSFVRYETDLAAGQGGTQLVTIDFSLKPVLVEGRVAYLLAEGRNISEKKAAEAELARRHAELVELHNRLKELDEAKTRFFANVSHELRTPLALIMGPLEQALADGQLPGTRRRDLELARQNARLLLKHVNDLLEVSRAEAGELRLDWSDVDLAALVRVTAGHFDAMALERGVRYRVEAPATFPAQLDPVKIERVLLNLLSNAFKFTPSGGQLRCTLRGADGRAILEVADDGPGVRPEVRDRIFERFQQGEEPDTRRFGGTGLGLAIARDFVQAHGGRIEVSTAPEGGALFTVELPLTAPPGVSVAIGASPAPGPTAELVAETTRLEATPAASPAAAPAAAAPAAGGGPSILVVEDNPSMAQFLHDALADLGRVAIAVDGQDGLEKAVALHPDLIVTDVMMPRLSGEALVRAARARPDLAAVPIVVLTAKEDEDLRLRLLSGGAQDWVGKPFSVDEVRARVGNLLATKRARDVLQAELASRAHDLEELAREVAYRKRELELALAAARVAHERAERASAARGTFLGLVSHELLTPLQTMQLNLDALLRRPDTMSATQRDRVEKLARSTVRLIRLIQSVLRYTQLQSGQVPVERAAVDLGSLVHDVADALRGRAVARGLALEVQVPAEPLVAVTDASLLRLALLHLVENAIEATRVGRVTVRATSDEDGVRLAVSDTGPGIPAAEQRRIFEPFVQLEPLDLKHAAGVGLGLALVRELTAALGARLTLASEVGAGSVFAIVLMGSAGGSDEAGAR